MRVGVADSFPILPPEWLNPAQRAAWFPILRDLGATEVRLPWFADFGSDQVGYERRLYETAREARRSKLWVSIVLHAQPASVGRIFTPLEFARRAATVAAVFGDSAARFVLWNEPNNIRFWNPPIEASDVPVVRRRRRARALFETVALLVDAIRARRPNVALSGLGLASSHEPFAFLEDFATAFRESGRNRPLWTELSFHPYPGSSLDGWRGPVDRVKMLRATHGRVFAGTAQPAAVPINCDEFGWECAVDVARGYRGTEVARTTTEARQAEMYATMIRELAALGYVRSALFYKLIDEPVLEDFQSGLLRVDGSRRPSFAAVQLEIDRLGA